MVELEGEKIIEEGEGEKIIEEGEGEVADELFGIEILSTISVAQNQNGLRHQDYKRYHRYCSRKIQKLRKGLKLTQGTNQKYIPKPITTETLRSSRELYIKLFESERYWAYGMYIKQRNAQTILDTHRSVFMLKQKFKKAGGAAEELFNICKEKMDERTTLEAQAYYCFIQGSGLIERELDYPQSLRLLQTAYKIYSIVAEQKDALETLMFKEKMDSILPFIRAALYKSNLDLASDQYLQLKEQVDLELTNKIANMEVREHQEKMTSGVAEVRYNNKVIPLKSDELKTLFAQIQEKVHALADITTDKEILVIYSELFKMYEEAKEQIMRERSEESKKSEGSGQLYTSLLNYIDNMRHEYLIQKILINISQITGKFEEVYKRDVVKLIFQSNKIKNKLCTDIMKLYSNLIKRIKSLKNIDKEGMDPLKVLIMDLREKAYCCFQMFYYAFSFLFQVKFVEAYYLLEHTQENIRKLDEVFEENPDAHNKKTNKLMEEVRGLVSKLEATKCKIQAKLTLDKSRNIGKLGGNVENVENKGIQGMKTKNEIMKEFTKSFSVFEGVKDQKYNNYEIETNYNIWEENIIRRIESDSNWPLITDTLNVQSLSNMKMVDRIPDIKPLHLSPQLLDVADQFITFPDIGRKLKVMKDKQKGFISKAFGKMFGKN